MASVNCGTGFHMKTQIAIKNVGASITTYIKEKEKLDEYRGSCDSFNYPNLGYLTFQ
jgi:hypothetical protein